MEPAGVLLFYNWFIHSIRTQCSTQKIGIILKYSFKKSVYYAMHMNYAQLLYYA